MLASKEAIPVLAILLATACQPRPTPAPEPPTRPAASQPASRPALPPGTLARVAGNQGTVEVVEREGKRLLLIDGVVQGAARLPLGKARGPIGLSDPLVALLAAGLPEAARPKLAALVIGLGTGQTASALRRAGIGRVEVVELEPAVITLARQHFGYRGHAVAGDGLAHLERVTGRRYDLILVDALTAKALPPHLVSSKALALMRSRLRGPSVIAARTVGSPKQVEIAGLARRLDRQAPTYLFGSGVGDEQQNLYFISGALRFTEVAGVAAWPVRLGGRSYTHSALSEPLVPELDPKAAADPTTRELTAIGYLVWDQRETGSRRLALDLPHDEMGMMRYLLRGPVAEQLARRHGKAITPPLKAGQDDRWRTASALQLLGGASTCGTGQLLSPVIVALRGKARLVSSTPHYGPWPLTGVDRARRRLMMRAGQGAGAVYSLEVERVLATFDKPGWRRLLSGKLARLLREAERLARAGQLLRAAQEITRGRELILAAVPEPLGGYLVPTRQLALLAEAMRRPPPEKLDLGTTLACDRAMSAAQPKIFSDGSPTPATKLLRALRRCAVDGYRKAARSPKRPASRVAAARLYYLLDYDGAPGDGGRKRIERQLRSLKKRYGPELSPRDRPPETRELR